MNSHIIIEQSGPSDDWVGFYPELADAIAAHWALEPAVQRYALIIEVREGLPLLRSDGVVYVPRDEGGFEASTQAEAWTGADPKAEERILIRWLKHGR